MPSFDTGIKVYGSLMDSMFTYELAVTNGRSHLQNQGRDNVDDNDGKEYAARITTAPFVQDKELGIWTTPNGDKVAWFKDPDGNILSISQHH